MRDKGKGFCQWKILSSQQWMDMRYSFGEDVRNHVTDCLRFSKDFKNWMKLSEQERINSISWQRKDGCDICWSKFWAYLGQQGHLNVCMLFQTKVRWFTGLKERCKPRNSVAQCPFSMPCSNQQCLQCCLKCCFCVYLWSAGCSVNRNTGGSTRAEIHFKIPLYLCPQPTQL